jgi:hypothetical protein
VNLEAILGAMKRRGATRFFYKVLAKNNNSKQQIYFGRDATTLNVLRGREIPVDENSPKHRFKIALRFNWLVSSGQFIPAPGAQLIYYPQYPEMRLSGMVRGTDQKLGDLLSDPKPGRVLILGVALDDEVIAHITQSRELIGALEALPEVGRMGVLREILPPGAPPNPRVELLGHLARVHRKGWIEACRLDSSGKRHAHPARNAGGTTLEAELGVRPNGKAEPDFLGWEIKQHGVRTFRHLNSGVITLMTPEPTAGLYVSKGVESFVRRFGYPDKRGRVDRLNFGGVHRCGRREETTGLTLTLMGFDPGRRRIIDPGGGIALLGPRDEEAARWSFSDIIKHWTHKHARAVYVPSMSRREPSQAYWYGPEVKLAAHPSVEELLAAIHNGKVYYDPGIKVESASSGRPKTKRRNQLRVRVQDLSALYREFETVSLV